MPNLIEISTAESFKEQAYGAAGQSTGLSELEHAILSTIAYRDLFDFAVTLDEIQRYLHFVRCSPGDIIAALEKGRFVNQYLESDGGLYALNGRRALFTLRRERNQVSKDLWSRALMRGAVIATLPFVRMVAVTGSLAADNAESGADTDFMLVTDGGRLWSTRAGANVLALLDKKFSTGELCPNYFRSTRALELDSKGLYEAQELVQMVPIYGFDVYESLRDANSWTNDYLPNATGAPAVEYRCEPYSRPIRRILEFALETRLGDRFESWESDRKLRRYNETEYLLGRMSPFSKEATGHRRIMKRAIESALEVRLNELPKYRNKLRLLFGQAYHLCLDPKLFREMQPFPPLGCLYAAAVARAQGHFVEVYDSMLSVYPNDWSLALRIHAPDVVVLYEDNFNYLTKMCLLAMREAAFKMIRLSKERGARVIVCSSDAADEPDLYLREGADFVLIGEGEDTLAEILGLISGTDDIAPESIKGLSYLDAHGRLVNTGRRPVIRSIDKLPLPAWDLVDLQQYEEIWTRRHGRFALNMVTTRGCPYHCNWCAKPIWGQRYNARSPEHVVSELAMLRETADVDYIWFMDDIFGLKPGWIARFAALLKENKIRIRFKCLSRPDILLRDGEIASLARAGCDIVWMGAESGSQTILDAMEKGTTVDMIHKSCDALRNHGIRVGLFIQFGYPGETKSDIRATISMVRQILPDELGISVSYPLPGTRFYDRVKAQLGQTRHWRDSDDLAMLFKGPFNTAYYRVLHRYVHRDLAIRKAWARPMSPRNLARVLYHGLHRSRLTLMMAVLSRLPHQGLSPMKAEMHPSAAATPSEQNAE